MLYWLYYLVLAAVLGLGMWINLMTLPGNWLMLAAVGVYALLTRHAHLVGWLSMLVLLLLASAGEIVETQAAGRGVRQQGGARRGAWGALIGGIAGGIVLSIPIPVLGTFIGILIGTFVGAVAGELTGGRDIGKAALIGVGAAKGRVYGTLLKLMFGAAIVIISLVVCFP